MGYNCSCCGCRHNDNDLSCQQLTENRTLIVPVEPMNQYELDIASGKYPPDTTYEQWRAMQEMTTNVIEYGDNA